VTVEQTTGASGEAEADVDVEIIRFEQEHLDSVVELSLRAWEPVFDSLKEALDPAVFRAFYPDWREVQRAAVSEACLAKDHETWVAVADDTVVGFVDTVVRDEVLGEIHMVAVDPPYQRQGVGTQLVEFAVETLREAGLSVAMVETGGDPGHESARISYEHAGFRLLPVARYFRPL
jgi:GNAT superfamily N-acetyltransferase